PRAVAPGRGGCNRAPRPPRGRADGSPPGSWRPPGRSGRRTRSFARRQPGPPRQRWWDVVAFARCLRRSAHGPGVDPTESSGDTGAVAVLPEGNARQSRQSMARSRRPVKFRSGRPKRTTRPQHRPTVRSDPLARTHIATTVRSPRFGADWWQRGVVYQIYPRSFADSNGDGIGDLPGIIDHLDYLGGGGLGVDALWLSPIYPSPGLDVGYDVSDHSRIDPIYGSEADFDRLVADLHRRGMRLILDLVMNHTSDRHAWFEASRASRDNPYADWYL